MSPLRKALVEIDIVLQDQRTTMNQAARGSSTIGSLMHLLETEHSLVLSLLAVNAQREAQLLVRFHVKTN